MTTITGSGIAIYPKNLIHHLVKCSFRLNVFATAQVRKTCLVSSSDEATQE